MWPLCASNPRRGPPCRALLCVLGVAWRPQKGVGSRGRALPPRSPERRSLEILAGHGGRFQASDLDGLSSKPALGPPPASASSPEFEPEAILVKESELERPLPAKVSNDPRSHTSLGRSVEPRTPPLQRAGRHRRPGCDLLDVDGALPAGPRRAVVGRRRARARRSWASAARPPGSAGSP